MIREFVDRYRHHAAVRRATRTAVVLPAVFALADKLIGNPDVATFAAFGSFSMLLLVEFGGSMRERIQAQLMLLLTGAVLVCVGTLASSHVWLSVVAMVIVGFVVLFVGVVSSVIAGATTSMLLAFIISVSAAGNAAAIPDRLAGWGLAGGASLIAISLLWPSQPQDPLRVSAVVACRALAARLRSDAAFRRSPMSDHDRAAHDEAIAASVNAIDSLRQAFQATPYRPTGLSTAARSTVRLVDELSWMNVILAQTITMTAAAAGSISLTVKEHAAAVLELGADLLASPELSREPLRAAVADMHTSLIAMEHEATIGLPGSRIDEDEVVDFITSLDPSFRAQEVSFAVALIARNIDRTVAADRRTWWERTLGHQPDGVPSALTAAQERAAAHIEPHSVWLHNSLRGAAGLALAVLLAGEVGLQHSFWVIFGTLSVLRSNALNTGQNVIRAVLGTVVGFAIGFGLLELIGTNTTVLWFVLPVVVALAGVAPILISFAAGQAAFTLTIVILYNIVQPVGWRLGLLRIEDVAIGCVVSLVVGLLFWPRGAAAALRFALSEAYADSANYLDRAVQFGADRCDRGRVVSTHELPSAPVDAAVRAAAASRRLDDTFRNYLAERGAKPVPLAEITSLVTAVAALRLAADAVVDLWEHDDDVDSGDRAAARAELLRASGIIKTWYDDLAASLVGSSISREPLPPDVSGDGHLIDAVRQDLRSPDGTATATAIRVIWTADHLDAVRRLQAIISDPAKTAVGTG